RVPRSEPRPDRTAERRGAGGLPEGTAGAVQNPCRVRVGGVDPAERLRQGRTEDGGGTARRVACAAGRRSAWLMHAPEVRLDREGGGAKSPWEHDPEVHYDRIMPAWRLLMGRNLHYGCFEAPDEDLDAATDNLTRRLAKHARLNA